MTRDAEHLLDAVKRFCAWAEGDRHGLLEARRHLLELMSAVAPLRHLCRADHGRTGLPERWMEDRERLFKRFADLPFQYYREVSDPHDWDGSDEPVTGDLHDDLADIHGDLSRGLQAFQAGESDQAVSHWIASYFSHWGAHASSAFSAIDSHFRSMPDRPVMPPDPAGEPDGSAGP